MGDVRGLICDLKHGAGGGKEGHPNKTTFGTRTRSWTGSLAVVRILGVEAAPKKAKRSPCPDPSALRSPEVEGKQSVNCGWVPTDCLQFGTLLCLEAERPWRGSRKF